MFSIREPHQFRFGTDKFETRGAVRFVRMAARLERCAVSGTQQSTVFIEAQINGLKEVLYEKYIY